MPKISAQDEDGYRLAMANLDNCSPEAKMVGEELENFFKRC